MSRKIGDVYGINGKDYIVSEEVNKDSCKGCAFINESYGFCKSLDCINSQGNGSDFIFKEYRENLKPRLLGDKFEIDGKKYVAVEELDFASCSGCAFKGIDPDKCIEVNNGHYCYNDIIFVPEENTTTKDNTHYKTTNTEVIDIIEENNLNFNLANVMKYILRAKHKGSEKEDLKKALNYLHREIYGEWYNG